MKNRTVVVEDVAILPMAVRPSPNDVQMLGFIGIDPEMKGINDAQHEHHRENRHPESSRDGFGRGHYLQRFLWRRVTRLIDGMRLPCGSTPDVGGSSLIMAHDSSDAVWKTSSLVPDDR